MKKKTPLLPPDVELFIKLYEQSRAELIKTITQNEQKGGIARFQRNLLTQVDENIEKLNKLSIKQGKKLTKKYYLQGIYEVEDKFKSYGLKEISVSFSKIHEQALVELIKNLNETLTEANYFVGRKIKDEIRETCLKASSLKLATGKTVEEAANMLKTNFLIRGLDGFKDSAGRVWNLDAYAGMVIRSTTREATNAGTLNHITGAGEDLVQVSQHNSPCNICSAYEGRVYSISGTNKNYPPLDAMFSGDYLNIHPNCFVDSQIPILTSKGWKAIGDIKINDLVLTHKGRFRRVTYLHNNKGKPNLVKIKIKNGSRNEERLHVTEGHPILINGIWKKAENVKVGDKIRILGKPCENCGKPALQYMKGCSKKCSMELCYKKRNTPEYRKQLAENGRKRMNKLYSEGLINGKERVKKAHEKVRELVSKGEFILQNPVVHIKAQKTLGSKNYGKTWIEEKMGWHLSSVLNLNIESQFPIPQIKKDVWGRQRYFFADFLIKDYKIIIECDGSFWHIDKEKDLKRQNYIESLGYRVLRFSGEEIRNNLEDCGKEIKRVIANHDKEYIFMDVEITSVKITKLKRTNKLYNFSVEEDESYIAKGFVVHNCVHVLTPYIEKYEDTEKDRAFSNRPFDIPDKDSKQLDTYNQAQKEKRQLRADKMQYEKYKAALKGKDKGVITFNRFRETKADPEKWTELKSTYRKELSELKKSD